MNVPFSDSRLFSFNLSLGLERRITTFFFGLVPDGVRCLPFFFAFPAPFPRRKVFLCFLRNASANYLKSLFASTSIFSPFFFDVSLRASNCFDSHPEQFHRSRRLTPLSLLLIFSCPDRNCFPCSFASVRSLFGLNS